MNKKHLQIVSIISACYVGAQILADITSLRVVMLLGFSVDAGTLIYPITFTIRDMIHKTAGKKVARSIILTAAGINLFMAGLFYVASQLPADMAVGSQEEFGMVLAPVLRIVIASIIAEVVSEIIDGEIYQLWVNRFQDKMQYMRVISSNSVAVPIDSLIFVAIAFWGYLPFAVLVSIFLANVLIKGATTLLSIPLIYMVDPLAHYANDNA